MANWSVEMLETVEAEISRWPDELRASLGRIFDRIEALGLSRVNEPLVKHLEGKIWEMRPSGKNIEGRALYVAAAGKRVVVVVAFLKKTQKTPRRLIELALERAEQVA